MEEKDTYSTIQAPSESLYKEKGSKFYAYAYPVANEAAVKQYLDAIRKAHHTARHVCYAFALGPDGAQFRYSDAGEPAGTAGAPIHGQLRSLELTHVLVIVVRYFGGVKLGVGGLIKAYRTAAREALDLAKVVERYQEDFLEVRFNYPEMNAVMGCINEFKGRILVQDFDERCKIRLGVRRKFTGQIRERLALMPNLEVLML